jgi:DNA-binding PadR family transcriptional regulator
MPAATTERARALRLLARHRNGCTEALVLAHGSTVPSLAGLVRDRLVSAELHPAGVVWIQITDLGREALAQQAAT